MVRKGKQSPSKTKDMHSYTSCLVHCVFSTKGREPILTPEVRERLWPYLGGIAREHRIKRAGHRGRSRPRPSSVEFAADTFGGEGDAVVKGELVEVVA